MWLARIHLVVAAVRLTAAAVIAVLALLALPLFVLVIPPSAFAGSGQPSALALEEIPPDYLQRYLAAPSRSCQGLRWNVLAAVGWVETRHGTLDAPPSR